MKILLIVYFEKENLLEEKRGLDKNYKIVLSKALKNYDMEKRLTRLKDRINDLSTDDLERIIDNLENETV